MADNETGKASKIDKQAEAGEASASAGTCGSEAGTQATKRGTTARLQFLPSGGLRLIPSAGGGGPGQVTSTTEAPKGQQRFFTRQTPDGRWQLLMSYDSDPGRLFLLQIPSSQPGRVPPASTAANNTKTDNPPVKLPMKAFVVNHTNSKIISAVLNNSRSLLGGQEKCVPQLSVAGKAVSLLAGNLRLAKTEVASTSTATASLRSGKTGSRGSVVLGLASDRKGIHMASVSTSTEGSAGTRGWSAPSPRLVQMEKPITSKRANKVVKTVAAGKLLSEALKKCKKFPKCKDEPKIKIEVSSDREYSRMREEDSDSADDLPVIFPFKIDSVFSLACPQGAVPAVTSEPNMMQTEEMKVKVKGEVKVKKEPGQEEIPGQAPNMSLEELLDLCGSSFVVLQRLTKQDIEEKGQLRVRSRCSEYCRKRTLNYLCMLNLIRCNPSKKRRLETDDCYHREEDSLLDEKPADEKAVQVANSAMHAGLPDRCVGGSEDLKSDIVEQSGKSQSKTVAPANILNKVASSADRLKIFLNFQSDDKTPMTSKCAPAVLTRSASGTSVTAATSLTLSNTTRLLAGQAACAAAKNVASAAKQSGDIPDGERKLVSKAKQDKVPDPSVSASATGGSTSGVLGPAVTSTTSSPVPSGPPTTCVLAFIITTSASTVNAQGSSVVTSSATGKNLGYQTLLVPTNILNNSVQAVSNTAVTATQLTTVSDAAVTVSQPKTAMSTGVAVTQPKTAMSTGVAVTQPTTAMSTGVAVTQPKTAMSTGVAVTQPKTAMSTGVAATQPTDDASNVPAVQTESPVLSIPEGNDKAQKANFSSPSVSTQSAVVVTSSAQFKMGGVSKPVFSSSSSSVMSGGATSGLLSGPVVMNPVIPALKTAFRSPTTTIAASTALHPPVTMTSSTPNSSSPAAVVGLQTCLPKGQGLLPESSAAILMSAGFSSSPGHPVHGASGINIPSSVAPTLVTFSKQTPTSSVVRLPLLASRPSAVTPRLPLSSSRLTSVSRNSSSSSSSSSSVTCLSNSSKSSPMTTVLAPATTSVSGGLSSGVQETTPGSSSKVSTMSKIRIVFPVNSTAQSAFKGTSLLKTLASSASSSKQTTLSSSTTIKSHPGKAQTGSTVGSETTTAVRSAQPDPGKDRSKVRIVTVVLPKKSESTDAQPVTSHVLSATLPPGMRLVKCEKAENGHQPRPKYTLISSGSTAVSISVPTDGGDKVADEDKPRKTSETAEDERSCARSVAEGADGKLKHGTERDAEAERRAKRARLERKYPLPPGVVIKCEPVTSGYPNDEPPSKNGCAVPTPTSPPALRTPGHPPSLVSSRFRTSPFSEAESQDAVPLPELARGGDEDIAVGEKQTDDCQLDEPPVLTPVSPLRGMASPAADTPSLITELPAARQQPPRLRVRIVRDRDRDTTMPSPSSLSSASVSRPSSLSSSASVPRPSSSSLLASVPRSSSSSSVLSSSSTNDRIRQLKEQLRKQQEELEEIRRRRAMEKPFRIENDI